ncbi:MAG: sigma-54-dependent transcriptional regulator [Sandaracinaceae bacterium]
MKKPSILVCDDEPALREMLQVLLRRSGYAVTPARDRAEAIALLEDPARFDAVITDLALPDGSGMDVLSKARESEEALQVLMITAYGGTDDALEAMRRGAYDFVQKPFRNHELLALLEKMLEKRKIVLENRTLRATLDGTFRNSGVIARSTAMRGVMEMVDRVASARTSVLVTGESGTGKEMVARALHTLSSRAEGPFVVVNCGALPEALMESELFGHEKGAFTGAAERREGLVRAAHGGTLFLDEVGELPPELQVKLLRVLQDRRVRPVGGASETDVDVRVVSATNRDLEADIETGRFRSDLFYRLNVIRLHLAPLRERPEDVALLAEHFVEKHSVLNGRSLTLSDDARAWIVRQPYPGNVRELENVIERAVTLARGRSITLEDLPAGQSLTPPPGAEVVIGDGFDLDAYLADIEHRILLRALEETDGVRTEAAKRLGMTFRSFRYRLRKFERDSALPDEPSDG